MEDMTVTNPGELTSRAELPLVPQPKRSIFLPMLVGLVVVGLSALAGYFYYQNNQLRTQIVTTLSSPNPVSSKELEDPTGDWQTYRGDGYEIKYPNRFIRLICPDEELTLIRREQGDERVGPISMPTCARGGRYVLETKTLSKLPPEPKSDDFYDVFANDVVVDGTSAVKYTYTLISTEPGPYSRWYSTIIVGGANKKNIEIYLGDERDESIFDQILSTFRFTSQ